MHSEQLTIPVQSPSFGYEIIAAARRRVGMPFRHHFKPVDTCERGRITLDDCMERGMDSNGYDCSGFVIAAICDVLGIPAQQWPGDFRHVAQMARLAVDTAPLPGDVLSLNAQEQTRAHTAIFAGGRSIIHASGAMKCTLEENNYDMFESVRTITASRIALPALSQAR